MPRELSYCWSCQRLLLTHRWHIVEIVLAYNGRPVILNIDWPNWGFGIAFIAIAGLLLWLPYTRPFAVHKASGFHLIHLVLFLLPIQIFGFAFIYAFIILYASYR